MNKLIKPVKKAIAKEYGYKNVSVINGSGTAWGWVHITINNQVRENKGIRENVYKVARQALKDEKMEAYTFCADDGYNTETDEILVQINYKD